MRWAAVLLIVCACTSDRERDCAQIRKVLPSDMPRRYWDYANSPSPREVLAKTKWRDSDVQAAVDEYLTGDSLGGTGWTSYVPYSTNSDPVYAHHTPRLLELCDVKPSRLR